MIYPGTKLICNDNSGALVVKCIGLKKASRHKGASVGDLIIVSVKSCLKGVGWVQKGSIQYGVIVRLNLNINWFKKIANYIWFMENNIVLVSKKNNYAPIGTRIFGPVAKEVWKPIFIKIVLLAAGVF
jgi:large subunit ribosomal protein L14